MSDCIYDIIGVGIGPFNLGLAALLEPVAEINALFLEQKTQFHWHPGLLIEGTTIQVPFLADLVTMADPSSRFSFQLLTGKISTLSLLFLGTVSHSPPGVQPLLSVGGTTTAKLPFWSKSRNNFPARKFSLFCSPNTGYYVRNYIYLSLSKFSFRSW